MLCCGISPVAGLVLETGRCLEFHRNLQIPMKGHLPPARSQANGEIVWERSTSCRRRIWTAVRWRTCLMNARRLLVKRHRTNSCHESGRVGQSGGQQWMPTWRGCGQPTTWTSLVRCDGKDEYTVCGKSNCRFANSETRDLAAVCWSGDTFSGRERNMSTTAAKSSRQAKPSDRRTCCGKQGHKKPECRFKDSKCSSSKRSPAPCASQLGKLSELRVVTFQNRLKTKQMFEKSKFWWQKLYLRRAALLEVRQRVALRTEL